jgi:hypothetical protein
MIIHTEPRFNPTDLHRAIADSGNLPPLLAFPPYGAEELGWEQFDEALTRLARTLSDE